MAQEDGEWPLEVESVCWGRIFGVAKETPDDEGSDYTLRFYPEHERDGAGD